MTKEIGDRLHIIQQKYLFTKTRQFNEKSETLKRETSR
jgi:hypothetical protein